MSIFVTVRWGVMAQAEAALRLAPQKQPSGSSCWKTGAKAAGAALACGALKRRFFPLVVLVVAGLWVGARAAETTSSQRYAPWQQTGGYPVASVQVPTPAHPSPAALRRGYVISPIPLWLLTDVGSDARSLLIGYDVGGGCQSPATARVRETANTIDVVLRQRVAVLGPNDACGQNDLQAVLRVRLRHPVAGRHIVQPALPAPGQPSSQRVPLGTELAPRQCPGLQCALVVPRVVGLSLSDARQVLLNDGFHSPIGGPDRPGQPGAVVVGQYPAAHTVRHSGVVAITSGASSSALKVTVPRVAGLGISSAYARLRAVGLRVSIPHRFILDFVAPVVARRVQPSAGRSVPRGSIVDLEAGVGCCVGSIVAPVKQPTYRVPDFIGGPASAAAAWAAARMLELYAYLGAMRAGSATNLLLNYRITRQSPSPGSKLRFSLGRSGTITPLVVWAKGA